MAMALPAGTKAMRGPKMISRRIEKSIPLAFECSLARSLPNQKACILKPAAQMRLLGLALRMGEAGKSSHPMLNQGRMANKDHVRRAGASVDKTDIGNSLQMVVEVLPLGKRSIPRGTMEIARH